MTIVHRMVDGYRNIVANLGTDRDKASHGNYAITFQNDVQLAMAYRNSSVAKAIVDLPAEDSCREWRAWMGESEQISLIEEVEKELQVKARVLEARTRARLMGGAAIFIGTGEEKLDKPLSPDRVKKGGLKYLTVLSKHEVTPVDIQRDPRDPNYGRPSMYQMNTGQDGTLLIHPTRLVTFFGVKNMDGYVLDNWDGWGHSELLSTIEKVMHLDGTVANVASLVFESKIDVINIKGLTASLREGGTEYEAELLARFGLAAKMKGTNGTLILDGDEVHSQKNTSFNTLPDILDRFMQLVAQASRIPMTRFFGTSPGGLNATGESDIRFYYDTIRQQQTLDMEPEMRILDACIVRSALGNAPKEVHYNWRPLWQLSESDKAEIANKLVDAAKKLLEMGVPEQVIIDAIVNAVTELGAFPGLDEAMEEFTKFIEEEEAVGALGLPPEEELFGGVVVNEPGKKSLADFNPNQPRFPAGSPLGGRWLGEGGGAALSAYDDVLAGMATPSYNVPKLKAIVLKGQKAPKTLSQYEAKKLNAIKKGLQDKKQSLQNVQLAAAQKAKLDLAHQTALKAVSTKKYPAAKVHGLLTKDPKALTQYEAKKLNAYKKALQAQQANAGGSAPVAPVAPVGGAPAAPAPKPAPTPKPAAPAAKTTSLSPEHDKAIASVATKQYPADKVKALVEKSLSGPKSLTQYEAKKVNAVKKAMQAQKAAIPTAAANPVGKTYTKEEILSGKSGYSNAGESYLKKDYGLASSSVPQSTYANEVKSLPPAEYSSLKNYTGAGYKSINKSLRSGSVPQSAKAIDSALARHTASKDFVVVRGFSRDAMQQLVPASGLQVGSTISDKGFLSTTRQVATAKNFSGGSSGSYVGVIRVKKGQTIAPVKHLSSYPGEDEFVIPRNTKLRILKIDTLHGVLELEYV